MNTKQRTLANFFGAMGLLLSGCGSVQVFDPTLTPTLIPTLTPTDTPIPTNTPSPTPTLIPTPTEIPKILNPENGHWYLAIYTFMSWRGARDYCRNMKADLVTITSKQENQFVYNLNPNSWIGLSDAIEEGSWKWVTDESVKYTNWEQYEPNNCTGCTGIHIAEGEDFAHFYENLPGKWNDWSNAESTFVCEWGISK